MFQYLGNLHLVHNASKVRLFVIIIEIKLSADKIKKT